MKTLLPLFMTLSLFAPAASSAAETTYILPVVATEVQGTTATWTSEINIFNPTDEEVILRVVQTLPLPGQQCPECLTSWSVPPKGRQGVRFPTGGVILEASGPLAVGHRMRAFDALNNRISFQLIPTYETLIPAGRLVTFPGAAAYSAINLFVGNPNDFPVTVETWVYEAPIPTTKFVEIPPRQTALVSLNDYLCVLSGGECISVGFPPPGFTVGFRADADVTALMSIVSGLGDAFAISPHVAPN